MTKQLKESEECIIMKVQAVVRMMGVESGMFDGKPNWKIGIMQGLESKVLYVDQETYDKCYNIPIATELDVILDFTERDKRTYFKLLEYKVINNQPIKKIS